MGTTAPKTPPAYVVTSTDHALRAAVMLQLEGGLTVSQVAVRLGVAQRSDERPDLPSLRAQLGRVRWSGFALNDGLSERGVVAVGVPVQGADGTAPAVLSVSMPSVRYDRDQLPAVVATLHRSAGAIEASRTD